MSTLIEKAKSLGDEIRNTSEFQALRDAELKMQDDTDAQKAISELQEKQKSLQFSQMSGVQPTEEQMNEVKAIQEKMMTYPSVENFAEVQKKFNAIMEQVNTAIKEGISGPEQES